MWRRTASAIALLLLAGCGSDQRSDAPGEPRPPAPDDATKAARPAVGPPSEIPWWSDGTLHTEDGVISTSMRQIVARGGTTIVGRATQHGSQWKILRGDALVDLVSTRSLGTRPVLSANGRHAAWVTSVLTRRSGDIDAETEFTVTAYDVGSGHVVGTTVLDSHTTCCDGGGVIAVAGVDNNGSVVLARYADRVWIWRPQGDPVEVRGPVKPRDVPGNDQWPGGVSWTAGSSSSDPARFASVSPGGVASRRGRVPVSQDGLWSPDGTSYAYRPFTKLGTRSPVVWSSRGRVRLRVRHAGDIIGWESPRAVILLALGRHGRSDTRPAVLIRCDVRTGACERAGPPVPRAHLPAHGAS